MLLHALALVLVSHGPNGHEATDDAPTCPTPTLSWETVRPLFVMHCFRCHAGPNSELSADARKHLDMATIPFAGHHGDGLTSIIEALTPGKDNDVSMPPDGPELPKKDIAMMVGWAECSATAWPKVQAASPKQVVHRFHEALRAGDSQAARSLLHPEVMIFEGGTAETSRTQYESHHLQADMAFAKGVTRTVTKELARTQGEHAIVLSAYTLEGVFRGRPVSVRGLETMVLAPFQEGWRITHIHWSDRQKD